jgi:hypothetical protein
MPYDVIRTGRADKLEDLYEIGDVVGTFQSLNSLLATF